MSRPWMFLLNWSGKRHTKYAAAWTLVNAHEVSGQSNGRNTGCV